MNDPIRPAEPDFGPWETMPAAELAREVIAVASPAKRGVGIIAVDGRSASGKTTLAATLAAHLPRAAVVHTDDVAWHHSFFDWSDLLVEHVIEPVGRGTPVDYRPTAWQERGRPGSIHVGTSTAWLIIEGVGAARRELACFIDAALWVASDPVIARVRGIERDGGDAAAEAFWDEWMAEEEPFQAEHRPWQRAAFVVNGTAAPDPDGRVVVTRRHS